MRVHLATSLVGALLTAFIAVPALAQPTVTSLSPAAVPPGKTVEVTLVGTKLDDPLSIWTSFPAKVEPVPPAEAKPGQTKRVVKITVDATAGVGVGGLVVATAEGATDVLFVMVDDLPSTADNGANQAFAQAQALTLPTAVDGVSDGPRFDYYKFDVQAGQRVAVEAVAGRLAQDFDPVIRLLDATGKELLLADDDAALGSDCRFAHTFQAAGQYVVEIRDNQYRGGGKYRLRVGDFPLVSTAYPLGVQAGVAAKVGFAGPTSEAVPQVDVNAPPTAAGGRISIGGKMAGGASSAAATIAVSRWPEAVEAEPNNEPAKATPMTAPGGANGRFDAPRDRDYFSFDAKKGQRFAFRAGSRSFGSPALVKMFIQKADGAALAESAVSDQDEETLVFAVPEDGSYRLAVEDLLKRGGPDFVYRVAVEPAPTFTLSLKPDKATRHKFVVAKNGALGIDVQCARSGYDGPVTLSVDGPGGAYQVFNNVIPDKGASIKLLVIPPAGFNPGQFAALKIVGKATVNNEEITSTTGTADLMRVLRPAIAYPPSWLDGVVSVSGAPDQAPFYTATLDRPAVLVPRHSGQSEFNVKLERANDAFKDPLTVLVIGGPPGVTYEVKRNGNGKQETYQVLVKGTPNMPENSTPVKVVSFGELAGKGLAVVSADLPIQVVTPLSVSVSPAGGLVFGNKQKLKLTVTRLASAEKQPVVVKWKKLPPGVTGPAEVTIPADQTSAEVELVAAADAPAGAINDLTVTATTKFQGADVTVDSAPLAAEVKK